MLLTPLQKILDPSVDYKDHAELIENVATFGNEGGAV